MKNCFNEWGKISGMFQYHWFSYLADNFYKIGLNKVKVGDKSLDTILVNDSALIDDCKINETNDYITDSEQKIKTQGRGNDYIYSFQSIIIHIVWT